MKTKINLLLALFIFTQYLFAQNAVEQSMVIESVKEGKHIYAIDGTHLLEEQEAEVAKFLRENPDYFEKAKLNKTSAWNFNVGDTRTWFAVDFTTNINYNAPSTCRAVGTHCYVFVEDSQWGNRVTQSQVDAVKEAFDNQTPANPSKGIYETNVETFGDTPDVDNDPKIIIFLLDIRDGFNGSGGYIAGYFSAANETRDNNAEIFFIDTNPLDLRTPSGLVEGLSTLAHEFQHMINWNYHKTSSSLTFINEGCSLIAEHINGYPFREQVRYSNETNYYLYGWRSDDVVLNDYSRAAKFTLYLYEQFGIEILKNIVQTTATGTNTYPSALTRIGATITFDQVIQNWFIANVVNDKTIKEEWGYSYTPIVKSNGINNYNSNITSNNVVQRFAVEYVSFLNGEGLEVDFPTRSASLIIKALKEGPGKKEIIDIMPGVTFSEPSFGSTYTSITFIIMNPTITTEQSYTINAKGGGKGVELTSFFGNEPTGYYQLPTGDTICVIFDRVSGGKLDSIKIAVRRVGYIVGAIYNYTGVARPTPLGTRLSEYFNLTSTSTPPVINQDGPLPYEIPYPNWVTQDLTIENISTDTPFAVAFGIPWDTENCAYIMSSTVAGGGFLNAYNYMTNQQPPDWFYLTGNDGGTVVYHIIAYIGFDNSRQAEAAVMPNVIEFGDVEIGEYKDVPIVIENRGNANLRVTNFAISGVNTSMFRRFSYPDSSTRTLVIAPSSSYTATVRFRPDSAGSKNAVLTISYNGDVASTTIQLSGNGLEPKPTHFQLEQNYPNPFNLSTNIQFSLEKAGMTKLTIFDILGRELTTLVNEMKDAGTYDITFYATDYASGIYYYKLQSDNMEQTKKMVLLK